MKFNKMGKIGTKYTIKEKLVFGFSIILVLMLLIVVSTYLLNKQISDYTYQIRGVEAPLELMVQEVIGYDAMLTGNAHEALLHAQIGDSAAVIEHKNKYDEIGAKLDKLLKSDAKILLEKSKRSNEQKTEVDDYLGQLDNINIKLVDLETRAFEAMEKGDTKAASSLIVSDKYTEYKSALYSIYLKWADVEKSVTEQYRQKILANSRNVLLINIVGGVLAIILSLIIAILITRSIVTPLENLRDIADELSSGNLNVKISSDLKNSKGVIGRLAIAYDKLISNSQLGLKKFVEYKVGGFKK